MHRFIKVFTLMLMATLLLVACAGSEPAPEPTEAPPTEAPAPAPTDEPEPTEAPEPTEVPEPTDEPAPEPTDEPEPTEAPEPTEEPAAEPTEEPAAEGGVFFSTQFGPVEEQEKFRAILSEAGYDFTASEEGPLLDVLLASQEAGGGEIDVVGALHGSFPPLAREDAMMNMIDVADDLSADRDFAQAFLDTGLLGTDDFLYYVPWMQATYIMAAHKDALEYLPDGADVNGLTWQEFADWCKNIADETGEARCGLPHAGLFHRFLEGYLFPSFTGGMVSNFRSEEAAAMMEWVQSSLWPYIHPQSINYEFMQEPLLAGEVMVAFDHTARLLDAFNEEPDNFVAFPAPAGAAGRGFMPVIVGLGIPESAPNPEAGAEMIEFLTRSDVQSAVLNDLGFFPVVGGVDTPNLPEGIAIEAGAVSAQASASDALPALLPVGLGERGGEINQIFRNAFDRIVLEGEEVESVLNEEGDNLQALMEETGAPCWAPDPAGDGPCVVNAGGASAGVGAVTSGETGGEAATSASTFFSTQFSPIEEQEKFRLILGEGGFDFTASEEGPLLDVLIASSESGEGEIDVVGALHGSFPPLARENAMMNMIDVAEDLLDDREIADAFLDTGLLGTDDFLYYVPWMQATYIMAANKEALEYLPDGADVNALTWEEFGAWCQNILDETGEARCGLPHAGLFHRFLEGYLFPSFTGGMVSNFRSDDATAMMEWVRDSLWPTIHPQSISYEFMQEPLLSGEVWVAFDHTARLIDAFNEEPDNFVAFPGPAGPAGRGFMPVIVGLGIPKSAPDAEVGAEVIEFLTRPDVQQAVLNDLGFFPVVGGVDTGNLPEGIGIEAAAVSAQANAKDALPALLPVGLGERGGEINQIFRNAFDRIVLEGEEIESVLNEEGDNLQALMEETGAPCWAPDPAGDGPCQVNGAGSGGETGSVPAREDVGFFSTQFSPIEEQEKFRAILGEGGFDFSASEEGPLLDLLIASSESGAGEINLIGALHGSFPPLARENAMANMIDVAEDLLDDREIADAFLDTGLLGTDDFLHYVPWMQATYIMAANTQALEFLPDGADVNALTWEEFGAWCQNILDETGEARCGLPHAGLFHRFLEGYLFPSFTGGMVSNFKSQEASVMMEWVRDSLWPTIHPQSINYDFMQEPLLSGEVWVAFDHTARLIDAFNEEPDNFVAFPGPAGPAGRGFMPVIVGLGIPESAPNPDVGAEVIEFLTRPDVQSAVLNDLGFFPVVGGVDTGNLPEGIGIEAAAVSAQANASDALPALLPVGLGERGGEINQIFRNAFDRIVLEGEEIDSVLAEEGDNLQALMDETGAPCWAPDPASDGPCQVNEPGSGGETGSAPAGEDVGFFSTQFSPIEEQENFRAILSEGGFDFSASEEGPLLDLLIASSESGAGEINVVGALHGSFPPLARENAMTNMIDVAEDLLDDREIADAFLDTGLLGTDDFLHYVPWMQATYIMAANTQALDYLPDGADVNALTWQEFAAWCKNIADETGEARCGLPHAGLFHRFLEGYLFPSFTGGMVSNFRSEEAAAMMAWVNESLWPYIHPQSINYEFMQEPLLSGEVWVAFDHTARLIEAFNEEPDNFVAFPGPAGPAGRGFMPVIVGLGIPESAPDPDVGAEVIEFLTRPDVQSAVLNDLGFFPVVGGVDTSNLPEGVGIEAGAVTAQATASDALPALLPVGLGERGGEINQIFRNAFDRIVLEGEEIDSVLNEEGDNLQALMEETGAPCWAPDATSDGPCPVNEAGASAGVGAVEVEAGSAGESGSGGETGSASAGDDVAFFSTQFSPIEEQEKFRAILGEGGFDFSASEEGPLLDLLIASSESGEGEINVVGALHGSFPPLARENAMTNMIDIAEDLLDEREIASAFLDTGLLGTDDFLYYVPWMQATYIMAANKQALEFLPSGADVNALTWEEFGAWCQNLLDETGEARCGLPHAGLFHRFLEGYLFPSFTGGMVSNFRSPEAVSMMEWARDSLWPTIHPQSINYEFMQEPMLAGEVWVAFDHTARLIEAFNEEPDNFIAFPAPAGAAGRGFMPVIVGLGIPASAPDPEKGAEVVEYLTRPDVQEAVLNNLGFFPVVDGVDTSNLPVGIAIEAGAVTAQATASDALPALLPVGLGERGGEINQIFRNAFDRIVLDGEEIETVLNEEGDNLQTLMDETGAPCWAPDPASEGPCPVK